MAFDITATASQMLILAHLLHLPSADFSELQQATHLAAKDCSLGVRRLIEAKLITKNAEGHLRLTRAGKEYANRMDTDGNVLERQPKLSIALIIENSKGELLAQQRLKHPYYGFWGRPTGKVRWGETVLEAAERELQEETGLTADLKWKGVYHKMDYRKGAHDLLEDKYFYIVYGKRPKGDLVADFDGGKNQWMLDDALVRQKKVFEGIYDITELARKDGFSILERKHYYEDDEY